MLLLKVCRITSLALDSYLFQAKTLTCKEGNQVFKYTIQPKISPNGYTIKYDIIDTIDITKDYVTADYIIVNELNTASDVSKSIDITKDYEMVDELNIIENNILTDDTL